MAKVAIRGVDVVALHRHGAAEMCIAFARRVL
jgi:hypothetical protein